MDIIIKPSTRKNKKFMAIIENKKIHFGQKGASDYPTHKDKNRKERYIARHKKRENWTKSGIKTAGFWSKNILWNKSTIKQSIKDIEGKFKLKIKFIS